MIELPEAIVIAGQITETLGGKRIARALSPSLRQARFGKAPLLCI